MTKVDPSLIGPTECDEEEAFVAFVDRLAREDIVRVHQVAEIAQRRSDPPAARWTSPLLRDIREHTRAQVDSLLVPKPDSQYKQRS